MKKWFVLMIIMMSVIMQLGCADTQKTNASSSLDSSYDLLLKKKEEEENEQRKKRFQNNLDSFKRAVVIRDMKLLEEYGASNGWFSMACESQERFDTVESLYLELADRKNADLLQEKNLGAADLEKDVKAVVARYILTVSRTAQSMTAAQRDTVGCTSERGSGSLVSLLDAVNLAARKYDVSLAEHGFPKGSLRTLMLREINAEMDEMEYRKEILSPDRITAKNAVTNMDDYLEDFEYLDFTDAELGITPAMRKVINNPPNTDE